MDKLYKITVKRVVSVSYCINVKHCAVNNLPYDCLPMKFVFYNLFSLGYVG